MMHFSPSHLPAASPHIHNPSRSRSPNKLLFQPKPASNEDVQPETTARPPQPVTNLQHQRHQPHAQPDSGCRTTKVCHRADPAPPLPRIRQRTAMPRDCRSWPPVTTSSPVRLPACHSAYSRPPSPSSDATTACPDWCDRSRPNGFKSRYAGANGRQG
ncbi:hypothetical protein B0J12DRAFT_203262 [Macrophomina phaseolina]|uniref:Uncharacterized protein n=1 Tax=Macrophomina phaseolina TaxID=35725 RepID=A0ABQ8G223_9PEZI|nr:hypothetical protein B0J12DRAFT_203262 [Macrophomina phaseolina]